MAEKKKKSAGKKREAPAKPARETINIRCRACFMTDGYAKVEETCKHCGTRIYTVDMM